MKGSARRESCRGTFISGGFRRIPAEAETACDSEKERKARPASHHEVNSRHSVSLLFLKLLHNQVTHRFSLQFSVDPFFFIQCGRASRVMSANPHTPDTSGTLNKKTATA